MKCGDARVTQPKHDFFLNLTSLGMIVEGYDVKLPAVSLAKEGTTVFNVKGLPPASYEYRFYLTGGSTHGRKAIGEAAFPSASSAQTRLSFRATSLAGENLFSSEVQLGMLRWSSLGPNMYPSVHLPKFTASSYRLAITVRQPSSAPDETLHIDAFGGDAAIQPTAERR